MTDSMLAWLQKSNEFREAYASLKDTLRDEVNPYLDTLPLSPDTRPDILYPLDMDECICLGADKDKLTCWIFFDEYAYDGKES